MKILVVDDERTLVKGIKFNLENEGYEVECAYDGAAAVELAREGKLDLIILDLMMPEVDGLEACMRIREFSNVPVIMLTAKSEDADKLMGFECGADDYLTKPFNILELKARVRALLRRAAGVQRTRGSILTAGGITLNTEERSAARGETPVDLTAKEYELLLLFAQNKNIALYRDRSEEEILSQLLDKYGSRPDVTEEELCACLEDVRALEKAGKLFSPDTFQPLAFDFKNRSAVVKALCLHVAHTCNLNCSYCFASQGKYHGGRAVMSFEVGRRALDFLIENSGSRVNLEVDFFGGEPLMNWDVVKELVAYARTQEEPHNKKFRFTLTTNGMLIDDDVIDFANREMHNVVLSLDGRKEIHNRLRVD